MSEIRFQLLWYEFVISTADAAVADALAYVVQDARQDLPVAETVRLRVDREGPGFVVSEVGSARVFAERDVDVVDVVYSRVHTAAFAHASREGWVRAHAAVADLGPTRVLLVGASGVGKTSLSMRLLLDGVEVQGDESVLLRDGIALPVPRPFHLKEGVEAVVPEVAPMLPGLPTVPATPPVRAFHPSLVAAWRTTMAPVAHLVLLERGDETVCEELEAVEAMHDVVQGVFWLHEPKATVIREIAWILRSARCHRVVMHDVADAASIVRGLGAS